MSLRLWIDDLRNPDSFGREGWHWSKTITEAIRLLATQDVDTVSLDHDISHAILPGDDNGKNVYQPVCCPEDYTAVARYIAAMDVDSQPRTVYVHTANPAGATAIMDILAGSPQITVIRRPA